MEIRWLAHSAFEIISQEGVKILIEQNGNNRKSHCNRKTAFNY